MKIEIEAKSIQIDKDEIRAKLKTLGAKLIFPERKFIRAVFDTPEMKIKRQWIRIRDEGNNHITMSLKQISDDKSLTGTSETMLTVDDFESAKNFLVSIGITMNRIEENLREEWEYEGIIIDIDTWPKIDPWVEIEASEEKLVVNMFQKLGLDYSKAFFASADVVYKEVYGMDILAMTELRF